MREAGSEEPNISLKTDTNYHDWVVAFKSANDCSSNEMKQIIRELSTNLALVQGLHHVRVFIPGKLIQTVESVPFDLILRARARHQKREQSGLDQGQVQITGL